MTSPTHTPLLVAHSQLSHALGWAARAMGNRSSSPALSGILLTVDNDTLRVAAQDGDEYAASVIEVSGGLGFGSRLVPGRLLLDMVKALPSGEVSLTLDGKTRLLISAGRTKFTLPLLDVEDYPALPDPGQIADTAEGKTLADAIRVVALVAAKDDTLPVLACVLIEADPDAGQLTLVATDRFRLALRRLPYTPVEGATRWTAKVMARELDGYIKAMTAAETITLGMSGNGSLFSVRIGDRVASTRTIDGDFPAYAALLDSVQTPHELRCDAGDLLAAVKRVALLARRETPVTLSIDPVGELTVTTSGEDGSATETLACQWTGEETFTIAFPAASLTDAVSTAGPGEVAIGLHAPGRPAMIRATGSAGEYLHLVMSQR